MVNIGTKKQKKLGLPMEKEKKLKEKYILGGYWSSNCFIFYTA